MVKKTTPWRHLLSLLLLCGVPLALLFAGNGLRNQVEQENLAIVEQAIRRAAVQCYALEGFYPPSLAYLQEEYGVAIDEKRYLADYQFIAANLMPELTVLPRQP